MFFLYLGKLVDLRNILKPSSPKNETEKAITPKDERPNEIIEGSQVRNT